MIKKSLLFLPLFFLSTFNSVAYEAMDEVESVYCFELCDDAATVIGNRYGLDHYAEYLVFRGCMGECGAE